MNIEQCERRSKIVVKNGIEWANNRNCYPLEQLDVAIISEYCSLNVPKCFYKFVESIDVNTVKAYGCHKSILNFLNKLQKEILKREIS